MKHSISLVLVSLLVFITGFSSKKFQSNTEFTCMKTLKAKDECHYNFLVDGGKFSFVDRGCRKKKEDVIEKVLEGTLPLGKGWKIECPMPKKEN